MQNPSVNLGESRTKRIDARCADGQRSRYVREAADMREEIERAADAVGVDTDGLPDGWWHAFVFEATVEHLESRRVDGEPAEIEA